jgi:hypothetical protein
MQVGDPVNMVTGQTLSMTSKMSLNSSGRLENRNIVLVGQPVATFTPSGDNRESAQRDNS